jgi:hypothetical protein
MLVIADPEKAIGLAGVMGGYNTEITQDTNILFWRVHPLTVVVSAQPPKPLALEAKHLAALKRGRYNKCGKGY